MYFTVDDMEKTLRRINANGVRPCLQKRTSGMYGFIAHFEDTGGTDWPCIQ
jgi:predicted enzyme related to lactoylglutathione lyase